jgi:Tfp pilus assembly protein PilF
LLWFPRAAALEPFAAAGVEETMKQFAFRLALLAVLPSLALAPVSSEAASTESKYSSPTPANAVAPKEPETAEEFFQAAVEAFRRGDSRAAENDARTAISFDSHVADFHYLLGKIYLYRGAEKNRLEIRNSGADSPETNYVKRYVRGRDELVLAKSEFEVVVRLDPKNAEGWLNLAICDDNLGNEDAGIESYKKAVSVAPYGLTARDAYNNLGLVYQADGKAEDALEAYRSALRIDPTFSATRLNLNRLLAANPKLKKKMEEK